MGLCKLINQEIEMYYLVTVDHAVMAAHLTSSDFEKCFLSSAVDETDDML